MNASRNAWLTAALVLCPALSLAAEKIRPAQPSLPVVEVSDVPTQTLTVPQGQYVVLPVKGVKRVAVGNTKVADAQVVPGDSTGTRAVQVMETPSETLHLSIGHQMSLTAKGLKRIALSNPTVADAMVLDGNEVLLTGLGAGESSLILWIGKNARVSYVLKVAQKSPEERAQELREVLSRGP